MARVDKFTRAAVGHLLAHFERRQKVNPQTGEMEYVRFGNRDIDTRWSPLNYRTWPPMAEDDVKARGLQADPQLEAAWEATGDPAGETSLDRWRRIYHGAEKAKRKDLASLCCWVASLPDPIPLDRAEQFFNLVTRYCIRKYGAENVVGAWVHWDEAGRPHIHVAFVPVVTSTGSDGSTTRRICAKEVLNRKHLQGWHGGLVDDVKKAMPGIEDPGILNGKTKEQGGNRTVSQMKASDRAYQRTRGREIDGYRAKALRAYQEACRRANRSTLDNLCMDAENRREHALQPSRKRTLGEILTRR